MVSGAVVAFDSRRSRLTDCPFWTRPKSTVLPVVRLPEPGWEIEAAATTLARSRDWTWFTMNIALYVATNDAPKRIRISVKLVGATTNGREGAELMAKPSPATEIVCRAIAVFVL